MPLTHDPEYQNELETLSLEATSTARGEKRRSLIFITAFLSLVIYVIKNLDVESTTETLLMLGACTISLIAVIHAAIGRIQTSLVLLIATTEWVGRKQLGEYEKPDN